MYNYAWNTEMSYLYNLNLHKCSGTLIIQTLILEYPNKFQDPMNMFILQVCPDYISFSSDGAYCCSHRTLWIESEHHRKSD